MNNGIIFEPYISLKGDYFSTYDESDNEFTNHSRFTPEATIKTSWPFFKNSSIGKQIIEPKLGISYIGKEDEDSNLLNEDSQTLNFNSLNLFESNRSYGHDKIDSGNKMSLGLNYNLQDNVGGLFKASLGKSFHIDGDNTFSGKKYSGTNNYHSDIVSSLSYDLNKTLLVDYKTRFDGSFKKKPI
jgi:LPS-assembly protein